MTELKPCPFCGGEATYGYVDVQEDYTGYWIQKPTVRCNGCYINVGDHINNDYAAEDWNTHQPAFDWKPIEELTTEPMPILLYMKSSSGRNVYLPAEILEVNDKGKSLIATEGGVSKLDNIKHIYTHYALLTPPENNQS